MDVMVSPEVGLEVTLKLREILVDGYRSLRSKRADNFFTYVDLRYDALSVDDKRKFNDYVRSVEGKEILASYADSIIGTPSDTVRMAFAILYCKDADFYFTDVDTFIFIHAMQGISDDAIDFFIEASKLPNSDGPSPYPRSYIDESRMDSFRSNGWGVEGIYVYVNDLIGRRLLLPDPAPEFSAGRHDGQWAVWFGVSSKSKRMANLLIKAKVLIENVEI